MELAIFVCCVLIVVCGIIRRAPWRWFPRREELPFPDLGPYTYRYQPELPPPEPWRLGKWGGEAVPVGLDVLTEIANPARLQMLAFKENEYLVELEADIKEHGIKEPLLLLVDSMGRVAMKEGHHRTIVASRIGMAALPVRFETSQGRVSYGRPLSGLMARFLLTAVREARR